MYTILLATFFGWYFVITSLFVLFKREYLKSVTIEVMKQRGLFFVLATFTFALGLFMVVSHNLWVMGWPIMVTLFSWVILVSGLFQLFLPDIANRMGLIFFSYPALTMVLSAIYMLTGLFLLYHVY